MKHDPMQNTFRRVLEDCPEIKREFHKKGLKDFFISDGPETNDPKWYASCVLIYFCYTNGAQNELFKLGVKGVVLFLNEYNFTRNSIIQGLARVKRMHRVTDPDQIYQVLNKYLASPPGNHIVK